jgi:hypothetical protein
MTRQEYLLIVYRPSGYWPKIHMAGQSTRVSSVLLNGYGHGHTGMLYESFTMRPARHSLLRP